MASIDVTPSVTSDVALHITSVQPRDIFSDLTLVCGGEEFKVHKIILYARSTYFKKLLAGPFKESSATSIDFPEDHPTAFSALLSFLYTEKAGLKGRSAADLVRVYAIADKYDVPQLRSLAVNQLRTKADPTKDVDDFLAMLAIIDECTSENSLWDIMLPKIKSNTAMLLKNELFTDLLQDQPALNLRLIEYLASDESSDGPLTTSTSSLVPRKRRLNYNDNYD